MIFLAKNEILRKKFFVNFFINQNLKNVVKTFNKKTLIIFFKSLLTKFHCKKIKKKIVKSI